MAQHIQKVFTVKGSTDDFTTCELCGREDLKGTVGLMPLDVEGNECGINDVVYYGTDCAARALGWTQSETRREIRRADQAAREAERAEQDRQRRQECGAENELYRAWLASTFGSTDDQAGGRIRTTWKVRGALKTRWFRACAEQGTDMPTVDFSRWQEGELTPHLPGLR